MKINFLRCTVFTIAILVCSSYHLCRGSDHADPQSVTNPFYVKPVPEANITDLHAFMVDRLVGENNQVIEGEHLIISLCVRSALIPEQESKLKFEGCKFRVHFDLSPEVVRSAGDRDTAIAKMFEGTNSRDSLHDMDRSMQALYGGIIPHPENINDNASLEFELKSTADATNTAQVAISGTPVIKGFNAAANVVQTAAELRPGVINIQAGIFDDPFIFPRFFRKNVVGIVTAIPLTAVPLPKGKAPILLWATSHKGQKQIDHVGRSLRTQLPRFGYLNDKPPSEHVKEITRVHASPTLMEDILATFISPLEAHRYYDSAPDVMIYDLRAPAKFPNGRALRDDVAKILAQAGETLLWELSYAESQQFPRAETNDKEFRDTFPYLAPRWTDDEIKQAAAPGAMMGTFAVPRAPEAAAIAFPNFKEPTWRKMFAFDLTAIALLTLLILGFLWPDQSSRVWWVALIAAAVIVTLLLTLPLEVTAILVPTVLILVFLWLVRPTQIFIWIALAICLTVIAIWLLKASLEMTAVVLLAALILVLLWLVQPLRVRLALAVLLAVIGFLLWKSPPQVTAVALPLVLVLVLFWFVQPSQIWIWSILAIALALIGIWLLMAPLDVSVIVLLAVLLFGLVWLVIPLQLRVPLAIVFAVVSTWLLRSLLAANATMPPLNMMQPGMKFRLSLLGLASVFIVFSWTAFALGAWWAERPCPSEPFPAGPQGVQPDEPRR
jgi:hypothetical protein